MTNAKPRLLLSSVFKPFSQDDEFGSRSINPLELYHNQVTRAQGPFSLRMHHRSWGLMMIQRNVSVPSTLLDFPTRERFIQELQTRRYDIVGLSGIIVNVGKVREMCRLVRQYSPQSTLVVGGHVTAIPGIERTLDADHIVKGEGIRWLREYLGEPVDAPIEHPPIASSFGFRIMGLRAPRGGGDPAATLIPSVGCPMGCGFCTTSSFFGGKGRFVNFYDTGEELYDVMCGIEQRLEVRTFFVMDENFLLHRRRAMELLDRMKRGGKAWSLYVFSSANAIRKYEMRELVELGISWVWMGLESLQSGFAKLKDVDTIALTRELQSHGIRVQGSTIIGMEHHAAGNLPVEIDHAVSHDADFHQFMLYTPVPGTPLHAEMSREGRLLEGVDLADIHGQYKFNFSHPHISRDESKQWLDYAFSRDYEVNGPSLFRLMRTTFEGWKRYKRDADQRVRARFAAEAERLRRGYGAALWAMERYLQTSPEVSARIRELRREIEAEFGLLTGAINRVAGPVVLWSARREAKRFPLGRPLEPRTFVEYRNAEG
ncbi:MAG TPA: cobalamin-dependent protein [Vicinamibacterales bacterium]|nr:cobalamin-dependent protein [Vicinamibacterales bacterium]